MDTATVMDVPTNWTELENTPFNDPDALAFEHTKRPLRAQMHLMESQFLTSILNTETGEFAVSMESSETREDAIERLRMHMEYYF